MTIIIDLRDDMIYEILPFFEIDVKVDIFESAIWLKESAAVKGGAPKLSSKNYATKTSAPTKQVPSQYKPARPTDMPKCRMRKAENGIDLLFE